MTTTDTQSMFTRSLTSVYAAAPTSTRELSDALTKSLEGNPLPDLVQLETDAGELLKAHDQDAARPIRFGIGCAVSAAARREVAAMTADAKTTAERARALYKVMELNQTGWTPLGLRKRGADLKQITDAELADKAGDMLDELMMKVHGMAWLDDQGEPLQRAMAEGVGSTIYRDWLRERIEQL